MSINKYKRMKKILERFQKELPEPDPTWPFKIREAVVFIHKHLFDKRLTVGWMKAQLDISNNNFSSKFKYYIGGMGPKQYLDYLRLMAAREVLQDIDSDGINITDISLDVGFENPSTFSRSFKKYFGSPPSDFFDVLEE